MRQCGSGQSPKLRSWRAGATAGLWLLVWTGLVGTVSGPAADARSGGGAGVGQRRRAHNEGKFDFAAERFREFLRLYGNHKDAPAANYGLGLCLVDGSKPDFTAAAAALQNVVGIADFPDRGMALYYLAAAQRGLGYLALAQAAAKPTEAANFRTQANQQFDPAAKNFAAAADALAARLQAANPPVPPDVPLAEWRARARCDQCEMLLRLDRTKEAADLATAWLADKANEASRFRHLALYHQGYASFALKDYLAAGKALSQLAPFQQEFGVHARYLLARTHHLADERPEATNQYKALLADFEQRKKAAAESLNNPGALTPDQRTRAEALARGPVPEYVTRRSSTRPCWRPRKAASPRPGRGSSRSSSSSRAGRWPTRRNCGRVTASCSCGSCPKPSSCCSRCTITRSWRTAPCGGPAGPSPKRRTRTTRRPGSRPSARRSTC